MKKIWEAWTNMSLVVRILFGLLIGAILGMIVPQAAAISILGDIFVGALKAQQRNKQPWRCDPHRHWPVYVQYVPGSGHCSVCEPAVSGKAHFSRCSDGYGSTAGYS